MSRSLSISVARAPFCSLLGSSDKKKARVCGSPEPATLRRTEMPSFKYLVGLSALSALWLNGNVTVSIDAAFSISATALILFAIFVR